MKKLLLIFVLFIGVSAYSQNADLLNTNWQITKIIWNGTTYLPPTTFQGTGNFYVNGTNPNIKSTYFNAMSGSFTFDTINQTFTKNFANCGLIDYWGDAGEVNQFSGMNCDFFIMPNSGNFTYSITTTPTSKTLVIINPLGNQIYYIYNILGAENSVLKNFKIYPTIVSDILNLENLENLSMINILDSSGKLVLSESNRGEKNRILNLKKLSPGIYFLKINNYKSIKFIKK